MGAKNELSERIKETISSRLQYCIKKSRFKKIEIARRIGVTSGGFSQILSGQTLPSVDKIIHLADIFQTTTDFLLGRTTYEEELLKTIPENLLPSYQAAKEKNPENLQQIIDTFAKMAEEYHSLTNSLSK